MEITLYKCNANGNTFNKNALPDHLTSALTKDYSADERAKLFHDNANRIYKL